VSLRKLIILRKKWSFSLTLGLAGKTQSRVREDFALRGQRVSVGKTHFRLVFLYALIMPINGRAYSGYKMKYLLLAFF